MLFKTVFSACSHNRSLNPAMRLRRSLPNQHISNVKISSLSDEDLKKLKPKQMQQLTKSQLSEISERLLSIQPNSLTAYDLENESWIATFTSRFVRWAPIMFKNGIWEMRYNTEQFVKGRSSVESYTSDTEKLKCEKMIWHNNLFNPLLYLLYACKINELAEDMDTSDLKKANKMISNLLTCYFNFPGILDQQEIEEQTDAAFQLMHFSANIKKENHHYQTMYREWSRFL